MTDNVQLKQRSGAQVSRSSVNKTGGRVLHSHREIVNRLKKTPVEERLNSDDNNKSERGNTHTTRDEKEIEIANAGLSHKTSTTEHRKSLTLNALTGRERRMSNGYGYRRSSVLSAFSDSQDFNYDDPDDGLMTDRVFLKVTPEEYMRKSYSRICGLEHITPCGSFQRQISDTVADISNSMLGPLDIKCICVALSNNVCIKELDLSGNDLSDKGAVYLAEALHENYTIDDLSVSECSISLDGLRDLCSILLEMKPMKRIDISKNNFGTQHVLLLAEVIKKNDYIEELVLSGNAIDNIGGTHIGKALMSNVGIKTLDLSWNHIRLQGAVSVCSALRFNQTLEDLDLSWNGLGEEGCKALGAALPLNHTLKQLDISSNRVSFQALMGLLPGLLRNDSLKLIRINSNPMTTDGAIAILKYLIKSDTSQLKDIHMSDIPINSEFLDALNELQKIRDIKVYHRYPNNKKITPIIRERTLHDHDPAMVLFEYMKQENIRLIDLFRTFDTDFSQALTKDELRDGFIKINMPLSDEALDTLFDRFDIDQNSQIEYSEVRSNYRKTISKIKYMTSVRHSDSENCFQKQLQNLVKKALAEKRTNYVLNAKKKLQRRISLTAIFKSANPNISFS